MHVNRLREWNDLLDISSRCVFTIRHRSCILAMSSSVNFAKLLSSHQRVTEPNPTQPYTYLDTNSSLIRFPTLFIFIAAIFVLFRRQQQRG